MTSRAESWNVAIGRRHSCRQFDPNRPLSAENLDQLRSVCQEFRPHKGARAELITESVDGVFKGLIGGYGKITGAGAFLAFVGDTTLASIYEKIGYTGEGVILEATSLGMATCWVSGSFNPGVVNSLLSTGSGEKVLAVSPVGYASGKTAFWEKAARTIVKSADRLPIEKLVTGVSMSELPDWTRDAVNAAR